ncbi:MAG: D-aminoacyl-tRNA deacylase [Candidatus Micrarchaeota archaeon]
MVIIVFSSRVEASNNIAKNMIDLGFMKTGEKEWQKDGLRLIDCDCDSILEVRTDFDTDCIIVLSSHKSKEERNEITAHFPGNWTDAKFGGSDSTLNIAHASLLKNILVSMKEQVSLAKLNYNVTMEVDHHGPTCKVPIIYAELGTHQKQWTDQKAAKVVAKAVLNAVQRQENYKTIFAIGGGHYPQKFNKLIFDSDQFAIGHVLPKYLFKSLDEDMFKQAIEKNVSKLEKVVLLKDEFNKAQKEFVKQLCLKFEALYEEI